MATDLMLHTSAVMATSTRTMLTGSIGPGWGSRDSGSSRGPASSSGSSSGTASRNTEPHQKCSSRKPPTMGPSAAPPLKPAAQMAMAVRRSAWSVKMLRINDRVAGISIAPKNPMAARAAMSAPAVGTKAATAEIAAKPVAPIRSRRRRPNRSPRLPMGTSRPASTSG